MAGSAERSSAHMGKSTIAGEDTVGDEDEVAMATEEGEAMEESDDAAMVSAATPPPTPAEALVCSDLQTV